MSSLKELNGRLSTQPYVSGFSPSDQDAKAFKEMFGDNHKVIQWAARMASYYQAERAELLSGPKPAAVSEKKEKVEADDELDLFGEQTEEEKAALEAKKVKDAEKKKEKKVVIAKSSILMDIKPWDDTIDLAALAKKLKGTARDGLIWGDSKLVPVAFGVKKLQQLIVIEDDKVSSDDIEDIIMGFEDEVQSIDIVAWNKI